MKGDTALKAAYIVTWVIQLGYMGYLWGRFRRVREEQRDLKREVGRCLLVEALAFRRGKSAIIETTGFSPGLLRR